MPLISKEQALQIEEDFFRLADLARASVVFRNARDKAASNELPYNPAWESEGGEFAGAVYDVELHELLPLGTTALCKTMKGVAILTGTDFGTVVTSTGKKGFIFNGPFSIRNQGWMAKPSTVESRMLAVLEGMPDINEAAVRQMVVDIDSKRQLAASQA